MPVFHPRTKIISFRVSQEEYEHLVRISAESGAQRVSDWARAAAFAHSGDPALMECDLQTRVEGLHREVQRLSELIDNSTISELVSSRRRRVRALT